MNGGCLALRDTMPGVSRRMCPEQTVTLMLAWLPTPEGEAALCYHPMLLCNLLLQPSFPSVASPRSSMHAISTSQGKQTSVPLQAALGTLNTTKGSGLRGWHSRGTRTGCHKARALGQYWVLRGSPLWSDEESRHWFSPDGLYSKRVLRPVILQQGCEELSTGQ